MVLAGLAAALLAAGCSSSGSSAANPAGSAGISSSTSAPGASAPGASAPGASAPADGSSSDAATTLADAFKGIVDPLPTSGPRAQQNKTIWYVNCLGFPSCVQTGDGFTAAAKVLGWTVKSVDDQNDPNLAITEIKQAVAAKASGIAVAPLDCPSIKAGLVAAKQAGIPVVDPYGLDCDYAGFGGGAPLFAAPLKLNGTSNAAEWYSNHGKQDANVFVAALQEAGLKSASIVDYKNTSEQPHLLQAESFDAQVKQLCPACQITDVEFTDQQLSGGAGTQLFENSVLQNPGVQAIYVPYGDVLPAGLQQGLTNARQLRVFCCGNGDPSLLAYIKNAPSDVHVIMDQYPWQFLGWALADVLNRAFAKEPAAQVPNEGGFAIWIDKTHNLPASSNDNVPPPVNYQAAYTKIWTGS